MHLRTLSFGAAAAIIATAALALLAAACGTSPRSHVAQLTSTAAQTGSSSNAPAVPAATDAVAYSRCMRSHGVPSFPDPGSGGGIPKESLQQLGVSEPRFQAAQSGCRHLLPNGGNGPTPAELQQAKAQALAYSRCVRAHGVPNFPDPGSDGRIPDPGTVGVNQGAPNFEAANQACGRYRPPYMPSNAAYNAWARSHDA